jgi:hypothetical protein
MTSVKCFNIQRSGYGGNGPPLDIDVKKYSQYLDLDNASIYSKDADEWMLEKVEGTHNFYCEETKTIYTVVNGKFSMYRANIDSIVISDMTFYVCRKGDVWERIGKGSGNVNNRVLYLALVRSNSPDIKIYNNSNNFYYVYKSNIYEVKEGISSELNGITGDIIFSKRGCLYMYVENTWKLMTTYNGNAKTYSLKTELKINGKVKITGNLCNVGVEFFLEKDLVNSETVLVGSVNAALKPCKNIASGNCYSITETDVTRLCTYIKGSNVYLYNDSGQVLKSGRSITIDITYGLK